MDSFLEIVEINDIKYNISGNYKFYAFSFDEYQRERERGVEGVGQGNRMSREIQSHDLFRCCS